MPRSLKLYEYEAGSAFGKPLGEPIEYMGNLSKGRSGKVYLSISPTNFDRSGLDLGKDYKLVVDGSLEYRVSNVVSSGRGNLGCPISSATVNGCRVGAGPWIQFDKSC